MAETDNEVAVGRGWGRGRLNRLLLKVVGPANVGVPRPAPTPDDHETGGSESQLR